MEKVKASVTNLAQEKADELVDTLAEVLGAETEEQKRFFAAGILGCLDSLGAAISQAPMPRTSAELLVNAHESLLISAEKLYVENGGDLEGSSEEVR